MSPAGADIIKAIQIAEGRRNREPAGRHPVHMGADVLRTPTTRIEVDPAVMGDVILGSFSPEPAVAIDRRCSNSPQAMQIAGSAGDVEQDAHRCYRGRPALPPEDRARGRRQGRDRGRFVMGARAIQSGYRESMA